MEPVVFLLAAYGSKKPPFKQSRLCDSFKAVGYFLMLSKVFKQQASITCNFEIHRIVRVSISGQVVVVDQSTNPKE